MSRIYDGASLMFFGFIMGCIFSPLGMFYPYYKIKEKYQNRSLLMLPASNLEKYITHYAFAGLTVFGILCGFAIADLMQYAIHTMMGHEGAMLMIVYLTQSQFISGLSAARTLL